MSADRNVRVHRMDRIKMCCEDHCRPASGALHKTDDVTDGICIDLEAQHLEASFEVGCATILFPGWSRNLGDPNPFFDLRIEMLFDIGKSGSNHRCVRELLREFRGVFFFCICQGGKAERNHHGQDARLHLLFPRGLFDQQDSFVDRIKPFDASFGDDSVVFEGNP